MMKPVPVEVDADITDIELVKCPRCSGYGSILQDAQNGELCNLCDGHGRVYKFHDGTYSNETDKNRYYW